MKKKIFGSISVLVIAIAVTFNVHLNMNKTNNASVLALANVEALASEFNWDGKSWNNTDEHIFGTHWMPVLTTCQIQFGVPPYVVIVDGHKVTCNYGKGNCLMASGCTNA